MSIIINLYYTGRNGSARQFAQEMISSGIVDRIRSRDGNERYEYFFPMDDPETVLLIDRWRDQKALDDHHASDLMGEISKLREKYDLHTRAERFTEEKMEEHDSSFLRK